MDDKKILGMNTNSIVSGIEAGSFSENKNVDSLYNVTAYLSDLAGCGFYRIAQPFMWLEERRAANIKLMNITSLIVHRRFSNLLIIQRQFHEKIMDHLKMVKEKYQIPIVYELDDDLWGISRNSPAFSTYHKSDVLTRAKECINFCDAVTTSTTPLAKVLREFNDNVFVLPNCLDFRLWKQRKEHLDKEKIVIGWFGSPTHFDDLDRIKNVFTTILNKNKNVIFRFMGYLYAPLKNYVSTGRVELVKGVKVEQYPRHAQLNAPDIFLIPVTDTRFNHSKSSLKWLEAAAMGVPVVASNEMPYKSVISHGKTGFLANTDIEWLNYINELIESAELRAKIGQASYEWVKKNRSISNEYLKWDQVYRSVIKGDYSGAKEFNIDNLKGEDIN